MAVCVKALYAQDRRIETQYAAALAKVDTYYYTKDSIGGGTVVKKATSASEKKDRKWYEAAKVGRKTAGKVTLTALLDALEHQKPGLIETQRRLSGVLVRHTEADKKKPKFKTQKNPVLIQDRFYIHPNYLLDACVKALPVSNTVETAISIVDSQSSQASSTQRSTNQGIVEVVAIKDVGNFTRRQIEIFKRIHTLKTAVQNGIGMHMWLVAEAIAALPAEQHDIVKQVADKVMETFSYERITGLPNLPDYDYAMLYSASPPTWLTDAATELP
ncbi:hypothetical protein PInf_023142 [Phytophthora infestans]|nr:hypothetical protein PInf_023142 [Phytophthora infestans]